MKMLEARARYIKLHTGNLQTFFKFKPLYIRFLRLKVSFEAHIIKNDVTYLRKNKTPIFCV
jgi:hypothetical protein